MTLEAIAARLLREYDEDRRRPPSFVTMGLLRDAVADMSDEPCRCGHPESAHTELGCGAPSSLVWDMTFGPDACTCAAFSDQEPEEPR